MSGLLGKSNASTVPRYTSLQVQTSALNQAIALAWGKNRISPNIIWWNDLVSHKQKQGKGGGKGGASYTYTVAVLLALAEGVLSAIDNVWKNSSLTTLSDLGLTLFTGTATQTPFSYISSKHPSEARSYARTAYLASSSLDLGSSPTIPQLSFECEFNLANTMPGTPDANLADIVLDFLTNPQYGMGLASSDLDAADLAIFKAYQQAQGLFFSPVLNAQDKATAILDRWAQLSNTWIFWSGNRLRFVPLGDSALSSGTDAFGTGSQWRYLVTTLSDGTDYSAAGFDDSGWSLGNAPFSDRSGAAVPAGFLPNPGTTVPLNKRVWMRRTFSYDSSVSTGANIESFVDDHYSIWINGTLIASGGSSNPAGDPVAFHYTGAIPPGLLINGTNVIAIRADDDVVEAGDRAYADARIAATTYTPVTTARYDLTINDFIVQSPGDAPLSVSRIDPADAYNRTIVQIKDRTLNYNANPIEYKDQTLVDLYGLRDNNNITADEICDAAVGLIAATLIGQRAADQRNSYTFKLGWKFILIEPGDIDTITDPNNAAITKLPIRITRVSEDENMVLSFEAEQFFGAATTGTVTSATPQPTSPTSFNQLVAPGDVNAPCVFEPSSELGGPTPQLWISASGGASWGGCTVYISFDNTTFINIGSITGKAQQGSLTATLASHADPDTTNTLAIDLTESAGVLDPVTHADADAFRTLTYLCAQPASHVVPTAGELVAYGAVASTGTYTDNLTYLRRALYGTAAASHASGGMFTRLDLTGTDGSLLKYDIPSQYIGSTVYLKFASKNIYGNADQDLSGLTAYSYTPAGTGFGGGSAGVPKAPTGLSDSALAGQIALSWNANASTDNVTGYDVYRGTGTGVAFGSCTKIASLGVGTSYTDNTVASSTAYTYYVVANNAVGSSSPSSALNVTSTATSGTWVQNAGNAPSVQEGLFSALPAAGTAGRIYIATDSKAIYRDNGLSWDLISGGGGGGGQQYEASGSGVPLAAGFTWVNQGDATVADGAGSLVLTGPANGSANIRCLVQTPPAAPYSIYCRFMPESVAAPTIQAGLILRNSTSGRILFLSFFSPNTTAILNRAWQRWTSATAFSANIQTTAQWTFTPWMRIDVTSTTATPFFSPNGWDWTDAGGSETLSTFINASGGTVDQMGFGAQVQNSQAAYFISVFQTAAPT